VTEKAFPQGSGFVTFASCMASEFSAEGPALQNGYFTRALLEGLLGHADANGDGVVTLAELDAYVAERVAALSKGKQQTAMQGPASIQSRRPLALVSGTPSASTVPPVATVPSEATTQISGPPPGWVPKQ